MGFYKFLMPKKKTNNFLSWEKDKFYFTSLITSNLIVIVIPQVIKEKFACISMVLNFFFKLSSNIIGTGTWGALNQNTYI